MSNSIKSLVGAAILSVIIIMLVSINILIYPIGDILIPLVVLIICKKYGNRYGLMSVVVTTILSVMLLGLNANSYSTIYGIIGVIVFKLASRVKSYTANLFIITICYGVFSLIQIIFVTYIISGITISKLLSTSVNSYEDLINSSGNQQYIDTLNSYIGKDMIKYLIVIASIFLMIFMAIIFMRFTNIIMKKIRLDFSFENMPYKTKWYIYDYIFVIALACTFLGYIFRSDSLGGYIFYIATSIFILFTLIQGVGSISVYLFKNSKMPNSLKNIIIIVILLFFYEGIIIIGIVDFLLDMRSHYDRNVIKIIGSKIKK